MIGGQPDSDLLRLAEGAAGNPLYLTELFGALARSSSLTITEAGTAAAAGVSVPESLSAAIADRLGFVTGPTRDMLRAAALLGADFAVADLALVLDRHVPGLLPAIDEACAAGVLAELDGSLGFRHPLIRATLYDEMPASVRAAWHRDAARAFAAAGASADRVARQMLRAVSGSPGMDDWMLEWLERAADPLVGQAPRVAAELLTRAIASTPPGSARYGLLASRLADALYRTGDRARAEQVANHALEHVTDPDLLVDLRCTLANCRRGAGSPEESLEMLDRALAVPGISVQHRARLLVQAARTYHSLGELAQAGQAGAGALSAASEAGDTWAMGWALHVLTLVTGSQGRTAEALAMSDQALAATESDPALADLHLLVQLNRSVALGGLGRCEEAVAIAEQARDLADQVGTVIRLGQAHSALGQLLFETGRWDDALTELTIVSQTLKEPAAACYDLGLAAVIRFHRGETGAARRHLAAAATYAAQIRRARLVASLPLARSLDREHDGALPEALAALTGVLDRHAEELEEIEALIGDGVRLAVQVGDLSTAQAIARRAASLATASPNPAPSSGRTVLPRPARPRGLPAARGREALPRRQQAAAASKGARGGRRGVHLHRRAPPGPGRVQSGRRDLRSSRRLRGRRPAPGRIPRPMASGAGRTASTARRTAAGPASRRPRSKSPPSSRRDCPTRKSPTGWCCPPGLSRPTSPTS